MQYRLLRDLRTSGRALLAGVTMDDEAPPGSFFHVAKRDVAAWIAAGYLERLELPTPPPAEDLPAAPVAVGAPVRKRRGGWKEV